jgi:hypothetical protein
MTQKINRSPPRAKSLSIREQLEQRIRDALSQQPGEAIDFDASGEDFGIEITASGNEEGKVELVLWCKGPESERFTGAPQKLLNEESEARENAAAQVLSAFRNSKEIVVTDQEAFVGKISDFMRILEESFPSKKPSLGR